MEFKIVYLFSGYLLSWIIKLCKNRTYSLLFRTYV